MDTPAFASLLWTLWGLVGVAGVVKLRVDRSRQTPNVDEGSIEALEADIGELIGHRHL